MENPESLRTTAASRKLLREEASALRTIRDRDFADALNLQQVVKFMDCVGADGEPEYGLRLADAVLAALAADGGIVGKAGNQVLLSSATNNWLAGNADLAMLTLDDLLDSGSLDESDVVRAAAVKARIMWFHNQKKESVEFLETIVARLGNGSEAKARTALNAARYSGMIQEYPSALLLVESIQHEIEDSGIDVSVDIEQTLGIELAWINLNLGHTLKALDILAELDRGKENAVSPRLQNFRAYVTSWCLAVRSGESLGDSIRDADCKFTYDPSIGDSQHAIGGAWARVQNGDILGAHNLFRAAAMVDKAESTALVVFNSLELALEGVFYTARELGREELAFDALSELKLLQSNDGLTVSVSGLVHGTTFTQINKGETNARLSSMRTLRRRGQFSQGVESMLVVRCILAECSLLQEAGLHEQELELRDYFKALMVSSAEEKTKSEFENDLRIATLTAILGDVPGAEAMLDQILPEIMSLHGNDDELTISARYAKSIVLGSLKLTSSSLDELRALQLDIEVVFGANSIMNLKAQYSIGCCLERAGDTSAALSVLLAVEANSTFKNSSEEFRRQVISKVAELFFAEGKYSRAINWYNLITRSTFTSPDHLTQREFKDHMMHGHAQAKAGRFKDARAYFEFVLAQTVSSDPKNLDMSVDGRAASAACAESLGLYAVAAEEYLAIVMMLNSHAALDDPRLWGTNISVARNYELGNNQASAFLHYEEALRVAQSMDTIDETSLQEIHWRRECCRQ